MTGLSSMTQPEVRDVNTHGFTLIELAIVIVIIGVLAAIAIPNYLGMQNKSKSSEPKVNLATIWHLEEAFRAQNDRYVNTPAARARTAFTGGWLTLGFSPKGSCRYTYDVTTANMSAFTCSAYGNLDGDPGVDAWTINQNGTLRQVSLD